MTSQASAILEDHSDTGENSFRMKRFDTIIDKKTGDFVKATQAILDHEKLLTFELEELRSIRESLKKELKQALQEELNHLISSLSKETSDAFRQSVRPLTEAPLEALQKISREADRTVSALKSMAIQSRTRLVLMGVSLVGSVCLAGGIMTAIFFYFFPQTTFVRYETKYEQILQIIYGKTVLDNFKKLKPEDQAFIEKATEETMRQMIARKNVS